MKFLSHNIVPISLIVLAAYLIYLTLDVWCTFAAIYIIITLTTSEKN